MSSAVAVLLDSQDMIAARAEGGADLTVFWAATYSMKLILRREIGGQRLVVRMPDGEEEDAHDLPISAILPRYGTAK